MDARKQDFSPTTLDFGAVRVKLARHFGFCFGVENAIEISYKAIAENPGKRIFLLSQIIHNPEVNEDLQSRGVIFLQDTLGNEITPINEVSKEDVVIIPAFGATLEIQSQLEKLGVDVLKYNTTCPFVEKVWKRSAKLGAENYTVVIHGKPDHEETRATFSYASSDGHAMIVADLDEALKLAEVIKGQGTNVDDFWALFEGRTTDGFDPSLHLQKVGVVNQTTMIASETQEIADKIKEAIGEAGFANTRDTLCYATNDNQKATMGALEEGEADLAIVVGGYNSSNTSHIVELCEKRMHTFFVRNELEWEEDGSLNHFNIHTQAMEKSIGFLPEQPTILITSGASCPDASVERVLMKVLDYYNCEKQGVRDVEFVLKTWEEANSP